jgi:hypothetical protein
LFLLQFSLTSLIGLYRDLEAGTTPQHGARLSPPEMSGRVGNTVTLNGSRVHLSLWVRLARIR